MTTTFTALLVMIACVVSIAIGFYYIGYLKGKEEEGSGMSDKHMQRILRDIYMQNLIERNVKEFFNQKDSPEVLYLEEHDPSIKTSLTDKDMLLLHIDMALDEGDSEKFMQLTEVLNGMEVLK